MELTGKCKDDFEKWLIIWIKDNVAWESETPTQEDVDHFYSFPLSMQWGVLVDFFDSKDIVLDIQPIINYNKEMYTNIELFIINITRINILQDLDNTFNDEFKTRAEAQIAAIKKANELYNKTNL